MVNERGFLATVCHAGCGRDEINDALLSRGLLSTTRPDEPPQSKFEVGPNVERLAGFHKLISKHTEYRVAGTPGECALYRLLKRHITYPKDLWFRRWARREGDGGPWLHAIISVVRDLNEQVTGGLLRYVNEDGDDAKTIQPKQSKGEVSGSAFKLPGEPPLILTEGVTSALAVWHATGRETWAVGGFKNFIQAPLRQQDVRLLVFGDNDEGKSCPSLLRERDFTVGDAIDAFVKEGREVTYVRPTEAGWDARDVLLREGEDALRRLVDHPTHLFPAHVRLSPKFELNKTLDKKEL